MKGMGNMSKKVYEMITNQIIKKLEKGVIPWQKPWVNGIAKNWETQKAYRGINIMLLDGGEYATFNQIKKAGGKVKKGAKSEIVVFWKMYKTKDKETDEEITIPLLRYYRVFKVGEQTEGIKPKQVKVEFDHDPIECAERVKDNYIDKPSFTYNSGRAYYQPLSDKINVPPLKDFKTVEGYYSTLFHEMIHSTGHEKRLDRKELTQLAPFGSETYSKEELTAEIGASMLCGVTGIIDETIDNSASYVQSWLNALKNDKTLIISASQKAQKAVDYILDNK